MSQVPLSSIATAQRLGPAIESQDPDTRPSPNGVAKRANRQSTRLLHGLNSFGGVPKPDGSASRDGSAGCGGSGVARVGEVGGVVSVCDAKGPWVGPVDQRRCVSSDESSVPLRDR
jgi:hypothetical protein